MNDRLSAFYEAMFALNQAGDGATDAIRAEVLTTWEALTTEETDMFLLFDALVTDIVL